MLRAVIFDMDGVIIDSEPMHARAAILALKKFNINITLDYLSSFIGSTTYYMCQKMVDDFHINAVPEELLAENEKMKKYLLETEGYTEIPYVTDLIKNLHKHGIKLIIASSSPSDSIEDVIQSLHIGEYFDGYITGMNVANPKPSPDIFLEAAKKLAVSPSECVVIEDSYNGITAAGAAGMTSIGFINPNSGKQDLSKASFLIEGFDEIDYSFVNKVYQYDHMEAVTILKTDRLIIRELSVEDMGPLFQIYQNPDTVKYLDDKMESLQLEKEKHSAYIKNVYHFYGYGLWGIFLKDTGVLIGRGGIEYKNSGDESEYELGYLLDPEHQGKGYALEFVTAIFHYCFTELQIPKITAIIDQCNLPSIKLAKKAGMHRLYEVKRNQRSCIKYEIRNDRI